MHYKYSGTKVKWMSDCVYQGTLTSKYPRVFTLIQLAPLQALFHNTGTLFYLIVAASHFPCACLIYKTMTCSEQCFCYMWCMCVSHIKPFIACSLNMYSKNVMLTVVHWTEIHGPWLMAIWNNEGFTTCHHDKWSKWSVMQVVRWNNGPVCE
jgi:hypothetical protein